MSSPGYGMTDAGEVADILIEARRAVLAAQDQVRQMQDGLGRAVHTLADVQWGQSRTARGETWPDPATFDQTLRDLARQCQDAGETGTGVQHQVTQARSAIQAADIVTEGLRPVTEQDKIDQEALRTRTAEMTRLLTQAEHPLQEAVDSLTRAGLVVRSFADNQHGTAPDLPTENWDRVLTGATVGTTELGESLDRLRDGTDRAASHAMGMAAAVQTRTTIEKDNPSSQTPGPQPNGIGR